MSITIVSDTRQKVGKHKVKDQYFEEHGIKCIRSKLPFGDYSLLTDMSTVVDTKFSCSELYMDLIQDHARFHNECVQSKEYGIKLIVLIENEFGFKDPRDIIRWENPQFKKWFMLKRKFDRGQLTKLPRQPVKNEQLIKIMGSMTRDYGVEFVFTSSKECPAKIIELLGGNV